MKHILLIDDDAFFIKTLSNYLKRFDYQVSTESNAESALTQIDKTKFDLVITDYKLPNSDGLSLIENLKKNHPEIPVILITNYSDIRTAVKSIKLGAFEFISKPIIPEEFKLVIQKALENKGSQETVSPQKTKSQPKQNTDKPELIKGVNARAIQLWQFARQVAPTKMSVLITGESGTGKEYVAQYIHDHSERAAQKFVAVDCGALPENIASSELFGHVKGAFTGATHDKVGQFEYADGGTLFLDEIGNLAYETQVKLLRVLQEQSIRRVGDTKDIKIDVRVIAATNEQLQFAIDENVFRLDLYHRLNEFELTTPALRHRGEDFEQFANFFIQNASEELQKPAPRISSKLMSRLSSYDWPGNLRELKNLMKRAVLLAQDGEILEAHLPQAILEKEQPKVNLKDAKEHQEKQLILDELEKQRYNKSKVAKALDIDRSTLYNKLKQYNIEL
ncbi:MAG: sigma-54 dependent transcriptional regulator [Psychroflexus sp.]|nr:sigma-54 dependent transcriptional regulator [Psychroflexus sp.]MDN6310313.1 sigma-54 dependent transcriptional regulator [Psychroflexus sp.]